MGNNNFFKQLSSIQADRFIILIILTVFTLGVVIGGIYSGITIILSHLLYFPIILAAYWYPRRCYPLLLVIAVVYITAIIIHDYPPDSELLAATVTRILIFTLIGVIVSLLSYRLRKTGRQLNDIIEFLPDAIFAIDVNGRVIAWNRAIEELTGIDKTRMINKGDYEYAVPFYGKRRPILIDLALKEDSGKKKYYPEVKKESGTYIADTLLPGFREQSGAHLHFSATALKDPYGNVTGAIETIRDVTDSVMTQSALSNTTKQLSTISEIIRADISRQTELILDILDNAESGESGIDLIIKKTRNQLTIIRRKLSILHDFSDLGNKSPAWLRVQDEIINAAERLDFNETSLCPWTRRLEIFADPHLSTVFYHLLENPLKFRNEVSRIIITYRISDDKCLISVEDDGPGIEAGDKENLFNQGVEEGYGHGLFLSHEILSITGIKIFETGISGKGAIFELIVPSGGFRIDSGERTDKTGESSADRVGFFAAENNEDSAPLVCELKPEEFRLADSVWVNYHNTKGNPKIDRIFGVFVSGKLVSVARCRRHPDGFEVDGVYTPEEHRGKGYARLVVGGLVRACHNDDLYMYSVSHLTDFYKEFGFFEISLNELPETIRDRYSWAQGNLEGAGVQPMLRRRTRYSPAGS